MPKIEAMLACALALGTLYGCGSDKTTDSPTSEQRILTPTPLANPTSEDKSSVPVFVLPPISEIISEIEKGRFPFAPFKPPTPISTSIPQ